MWLEPTVSGYAAHGFGYNLTNTKVSSILNRGSKEAIDQWKSLPLSTPGLSNIPVCVLSNMMDSLGGDSSYGCESMFSFSVMAIHDHVFLCYYADDVSVAQQMGKDEVLCPDHSRG